MPADSVVYLVDDDDSVRKAVSRLFRSAGLRVESFRSADEFLAFQIHQAAGCLILDVNMPGISGIELQKKLNDDHSDLPIVFITGEGDIPMTVDAIKAGAVDFLPKPVDNDRLLETVQKAILQHGATKSRTSRLSEFLRQIDTLTERERQVMDLVVKGLLNKQIAKQLQISEATVKVHRGRAMEKSGVDSVAELARLYERAGFTD